MRAAAPPKQVERLGKLLGLLGSAHDGERANAAAAADRHLRSLGLDWATLVRRAFADPPPEPARRPAPTPGGPPVFDAQARIRWLLCRDEFLSEWELRFVRDLSRWRGHLTPRQWAKLNGVTQAVEDRLAGCAR